MAFDPEIDIAQVLIRCIQGGKKGKINKHAYTSIWQSRVCPSDAIVFNQWLSARLISSALLMDTTVLNKHLKMFMVVNIGSSNGLSADGIKPLPEPMVIDRITQTCSQESQNPVVVKMLLKTIFQPMG